MLLVQYFNQLKEKIKRNKSLSTLKESHSLVSSISILLFCCVRHFIHHLFFLSLSFFFNYCTLITYYFRGVISVAACTQSIIFKYNLHSFIQSLVIVALIFFFHYFSYNCCTFLFLLFYRHCEIHLVMRMII